MHTNTNIPMHPTSLTPATWFWLLVPLAIVLALSIWTYIRQKKDHKE